jgi:hypothetical protein
VGPWTDHRPAACRQHRLPRLASKEGQLTLSLVGTWVAATLTIGILSFLYKDNPLYRAAEHLYVGTSAGFAIIYAWSFDVYPMLVEQFNRHLLSREQVTRTIVEWPVAWSVNAFTYQHNYVEAWILLVPALLGVLMLTRSNLTLPAMAALCVLMTIFHDFSWILVVLAGMCVAAFIPTLVNPRIDWVSRWPIAFTVGIGSGLAVTAAVQGYLLPQVSDTLRPLVNANNIVVFIGVITTLFYFYFSREHTGALGVASRVGIVFIMVAFGASFGYTVMARISLLIGRFYFLLHDWLPVIR